MDRGVVRSMLRLATDAPRRECLGEEDVIDGDPVDVVGTWVASMELSLSRPTGLVVGALPDPELFHGVGE